MRDSASMTGRSTSSRAPLRNATTTTNLVLAFDSSIWTWAKLRSRLQGPRDPKISAPWTKSWPSTGVIVSPQRGFGTRAWIGRRPSRTSSHCQRSYHHEKAIPCDIGLSLGRIHPAGARSVGCDRSGESSANHLDGVTDAAAAHQRSTDVGERGEESQVAELQFFVTTA